MQKRCSKCKEFKPATPEYFHRDKGRRDGLNAVCKKCAAEYYQEHRQEMIAASRQRYRANPQMYINTVRQYKKNNPEKGEGSPEKRAARGRRNYFDNIEKRRQQAKEWFSKNQEKARVIFHRRRARIKSNGGSYTIEEWQALCKKYNYLCLCCKEYKPLTVDHVIPISKGGKNTIDNIQPLCHQCNSKKHQNTIDYR